jgi:hypothetical protein
MIKHMDMLGDLPEIKEFTWDPRKLEEAWHKANDVPIYEPVIREYNYQVDDDINMSFREIAAVLGVSHMTIKRDYHQAMDKLRKRCPQFGLTEDCLISEPETTHPLPMAVNEMLHS